MNSNLEGSESAVMVIVPQQVFTMGDREDGRQRQSVLGCIAPSTMNCSGGMVEPGQASRPSLHPVLEQVHWHTHKAQLQRAQTQPEFRL